MRVAVNIVSAKKVAAKEKIEDLDEKRIVPKMMLRRRLTRNAKIMLYLADACSFKGGKIIYGSAFGELHATVGITNAIAEGTPISPTLFQNSVYNSAPSYFSLLNEDRDEIITISSGMQTSKDALKSAALQALVSKERVLCVVSESLNIERIEEVNDCSEYLEAGAAVVLEVAEESTGAKEISVGKNETIIASVHDIFTLVDMFESGDCKVFIEL
jgi:hypothetical protein